MFAVRTAAEACSQIQLGAPPRSAARRHGAARFLDALIAAGHLPDALRFLAAALPKREAVWWACVCARQGYGAVVPSPAGAALQAAERWVADPSDANRRAAHPAAEAAGVGTPAGAAAIGVFLSGGSLAPVNLPACRPLPITPPPLRSADRFDLRPCFPSRRRPSPNSGAFWNWVLRSRAARTAGKNRPLRGAVDGVPFPSPKTLAAPLAPAVFRATMPEHRLVASAPRPSEGPVSPCPRAG